MMLTKQNEAMLINLSWTPNDALQTKRSKLNQLYHETKNNHYNPKQVKIKQNNQENQNVVSQA